MEVQTENVENIPCTVRVEITVSAKHQEELAQKFLKRCERFENLTLKVRDYWADEYLLRFEGTTSDNMAIDECFARALRGDATDVCWVVTGHMNEAIASVRATKCFLKEDPYGMRDGCGWREADSYGGKRFYNCDCYEYEELAL